MRKLGLIGGAAATLLGATVVMAASPAASPSPSPSAPPSKTPAVSPAPAAKSSTPAAKSSAPATANAWSAAVQPLTLQGTATFDKHSDGTATLVMKMQGLDPTAGWSVTVFAGGSGRFDTRSVLFHWTSGDVDRLGNATISVRLTKAQYASLARARTSNGLSMLVSDGSREALATFAKA